MHSSSAVRLFLLIAHAAAAVFEATELANLGKLERSVVLGEQHHTQPFAYWLPPPSATASGGRGTTPASGAPSWRISGRLRPPGRPPIRRPGKNEEDFEASEISERYGDPPPPRVRPPGRPPDDEMIRGLAARYGTSSGQPPAAAAETPDRPGSTARQPSWSNPIAYLMAPQGQSSVPEQHELKVSDVAATAASAGARGGASGDGSGAGWLVSDFAAQGSRPRTTRRDAATQTEPEGPKARDPESRKIRRTESFRKKAFRRARQEEKEKRARQARKPSPSSPSESREGDDSSSPSSTQQQQVKAAEEPDPIQEFAGNWLLEKVEDIKGEEMLVYFGANWVKKKIASFFKYGEGKLRMSVNPEREGPKYLFKKYSFTPAISKFGFQRPATLKLETPVIGQTVVGEDKELGGTFYLESKLVRYENDEQPNEREGVPRTGNFLYLGVRFIGDKNKTFAGKETHILWKSWTNPSDNSKMLTQYRWVPQKGKETQRVRDIETKGVDESSVNMIQHWKKTGEFDLTAYSVEQVRDNTKGVKILQQGEALFQSVGTSGTGQSFAIDPAGNLEKLDVAPEPFAGSTAIQTISILTM